MIDPAEKGQISAKALARRDRPAWNLAFSTHGGDVYAFIFYLVRGNQTLAEELHQDVWLAAIDRIEQFSPERGALRDWLIAIARNRVTQHYRRELGRGTVSSGDSLADVLNDDHRAAMLPEDVLEALERQDVVRASLMELPCAARESLIFKYVDGLPVHEIAARTGRSPKAIESLLSRARDQFRKSLDWYFSTSQGERK